jgi:hypothetical protein
MIVATVIQQTILIMKPSSMIGIDLLGKNMISPLLYKGTPFKVHPLLPCTKAVARCIPKPDKTKREFWQDETGDQLVWGYSETKEFSTTLYLSQAAFDRFSQAICGTSAQGHSYVDQNNLFVPMKKCSSCNHLAEAVF